MAGTKYVTYTVEQLLKAIESGESLEGAVLIDLDLHRVGFRELNLKRTVWQSVRVTSADFSGADLTGAQFLESELDGARFDRANLTGASFVYSTAKQSSFVSARLHDTKLLDVDLTGAVACHSSWQGAFLQQADLSTTDLSQAQIVELSAEALILDGANMH